MSEPYGPDGDCKHCHRHSCDNGDSICNERQAEEADDAALIEMIEAHKRKQAVPGIGISRIRS